MNAFHVSLTRIREIVDYRAGDFTRRCQVGKVLRDRSELNVRRG